MARQAVWNFMPEARGNMSLASDAELADAFDAMHQSSTLSFPNPVHTEIKRRGKPFLESNTVLCILHSQVGISSANLEQHVFAKLKHAATIKTIRMEPVTSRDEESTFDFADFSELVNRFLPCLQAIAITHMKIKNFQLMHIASLQSLELTDPQMQDCSWNLELAELRSLVMNNHTPPETAFARSIIQCPRLETYFSHKYWNNEDIPTLFLPNCKSFTWRRGDGTEKLSLYAPRLEEVNLDACYELKEFNLLKKGHHSHGEWNVPDGQPHSKFSFSCQNACIGRRAKTALRESGRLKNPIHEEDDEDMGVDAFQRHMHTHMAGMSEHAGIEGLFQAMQGATSSWHDRLQVQDADEAFQDMEEDEEDDSFDEDMEEDEEGDSLDGDGEESDEPTARNPWGRDGDGLRGGVDAFQKLAENVMKSQGCSFIDACAARDEDGFNAVHHCAFQGYDETLAFLIQNSGSDVSGLLKAPTITGEAPLHLAVQYKRDKCIELLLKAGANVKAKDKYGKSVLDYVTNPKDCIATFQIEGDQEFRSQMHIRFKHADWLQTAANLCRIEGLTSESGQKLNGQTCQKMSVDESSGRHIVRFGVADPPSAWKKLKAENLKAIASKPE